jgi:hypothetical protein
LVLKVVVFVAHLLRRPQYSVISRFAICYVVLNELGRPEHGIGILLLLHVLFLDSQSLRHEIAICSVVLSHLGRTEAWYRRSCSVACLTSSLPTLWVLSPPPWFRCSFSTLRQGDSNQYNHLKPSRNPPHGLKAPLSPSGE